MNRKYVAVIESYAVRDTQFAKKNDVNPLDDAAWEDLPGAQVYLGIFTGSYDEVLKEAAAFAGTAPENIGLIDVNSDADQ